MHIHVYIYSITLSAALRSVLGLIRECMILRQGMVTAAMTTGLLWLRDRRNNDITVKDDESTFMAYEIYFTNLF